MNSVKSELKHVEKVENDIIQKENKLEKKADSWGEAQGANHETHMPPLIPHEMPSFMSHFGFPMHDIGDTIKRDMDKLRDSMFGEKHQHHDSQPAIHFRFGPLSFGEDD